MRTQQSSMALNTKDKIETADVWYLLEFLHLVVESIQKNEFEYFELSVYVAMCFVSKMLGAHISNELYS